MGGLGGQGLQTHSPVYVKMPRRQEAAHSREDCLAFPPSIPATLPGLPASFLHAHTSLWALSLCLILAGYWLMPLTFKVLHVVSWEVEQEEDKHPLGRAAAQRLGWQETSGTYTRVTVTAGPRRQLAGKVGPLQKVALARAHPRMSGLPPPCHLTLATFGSHSVPEEPHMASSFLLTS